MGNGMSPHLTYSRHWGNVSSLFSPFLTKGESGWFPRSCTTDFKNSDPSLHQIPCQSLSCLCVCHRLLPSSLLHKLLLSKCPWHRWLYQVRHSSPQLTDSGTIPSSRTVPLFSKFLFQLPPRKLFFNKCFFPALCVPSSQQLKCKIDKESKRVNALKCNTLPSATETPILVVLRKKTSNWKQQQTCYLFVETGKSIFLKSQFFCWLFKKIRVSLKFIIFFSNLHLTWGSNSTPRSRVRGSPDWASQVPFFC